MRRSAAAFLRLAGPVAGLRVLVVGCDTLETLCRLNEQGAISVTTARAGRCLPCEPVDLVIVPQLDCAAVAYCAIAHAAGASLLLRFVPDAPAGLLTTVTQSLRKGGFSMAQVELPGRIAIRARRHS